MFEKVTSLIPIDANVTKTSKSFLFSLKKRRFPGPRVYIESFFEEFS